MRRQRLLLASAVLCAACGSDDGSYGGGGSITPPSSSQVATVNVSPITAVVTVGDTLRLRAVTLEAGGTVLSGRVVAWSSEAPTQATVSTTGLVMAMAPGSVRISALSEGRTGQAALTVLAR
jgi:uncharacterized protein YjdB